MEHEQATTLMAAERYLLGELTDAERDQFEEHFFDCAVCAEDVRRGAIFRANARAVFADRPRQASVQPGWWDWIRLAPVPAASVACLVALLAGGLGYEAVATRRLQREVAELRAPQSYPVFFLRGFTRGAEQPIEMPATSQFVGLSLDLTPGQTFGHYFGEVSGESGGVLFTVPLAKPKTPGELHLLIPVSSLELGKRYRLVIRGLDEPSTGKAGTEIASYYFTPQRN